MGKCCLLGIVLLVGLHSCRCFLDFPLDEDGEPLQNNEQMENTVNTILDIKRVVENAIRMLSMQQTISPQKKNLSDSNINNQLNTLLHSKNLKPPTSSSSSVASPIGHDVALSQNIQPKENCTTLPTTQIVDIPSAHNRQLPSYFEGSQTIAMTPENRASSLKSKDTGINGQRTNIKADLLSTKFDSNLGSKYLSIGNMPNTVQAPTIDFSNDLSTEKGITFLEPGLRIILGQQILGMATNPSDKKTIVVSSRMDSSHKSEEAKIDLKSVSLTLSPSLTHPSGLSSNHQQQKSGQSQTRSTNGINLVNKNKSIVQQQQPSSENPKVQQPTISDTVTDTFYQRQISDKYTNSKTVSQKQQQQGYDKTVSQQQQEYDQTASQQQQGYDHTVSQQQQGHYQTVSQQQQGYGETVSQQQQGYDQTAIQQQGYDQTVSQQQQGYGHPVSKQQQGSDQTVSQKHQGSDQTVSQQQQGSGQTVSQQQQRYDQTASQQQQGNDQNVNKQHQVYKTVSHQQQGYHQSVSQQQQGYDQTVSQQQQGYDKTASQQQQGYKQTASQQQQGSEHTVSQQQQVYDQTKSQQQQGSEQAVNQQQKGYDQTESQQQQQQLYDQTVSLKQQVYDQTVSHEQQVYDQTVSKQQHGYDQAVSIQQQGSNQTVSQQQQGYHQTVSQQPQGYDQTTSQQQQGYSKTVSQQQRGYDQTASQQQEGSEQTFSPQQQEYSLTISQQQQGYDQTVNKQHQGYGQTVSQQHHEYDQTVSQQQQGYDKTVSQQQQRYDQTVSQQPGGHNKTVSQQQGYEQTVSQQEQGSEHNVSQQQGYRRTVSQPQHRFDQTVSQQQQESEQTLSQQQQGYAQTVSQQQQGYGRTVSKQQQEGNDQTVNKQQQGYDQNVSQQQQGSEQTVSQQQQGYVQTVSQQQQGYDQTVSKQQTEYGQTVSQQQQGYNHTVTQPQQGSEHNVSQQQQGYDKAVSHQQQGYGQTFSQKQGYSQTVSQQQQGSEQTFSQQVNEHAVSQQQQGYGQTVSQQQGSEQTVSQQQQGYGQTVSQPQHGYDKTVSQQQQGYGQTISQQQQEYDKTISQQQQEYDKTISQQQQGYDKTISQQQQGYDKTISQQQQGYDKTIIQQQQGYDKTVSQQQQGNGQTVSQQQVGYDKTVSQQQQGDGQTVSQQQVGYDKTVSQQQQGYDQTVGQQQQGSNKILTQQQSLSKQTVSQHHDTSFQTLSQQKKHDFTITALNHQQNGPTSALSYQQQGSDQTFRQQDGVDISLGRQYDIHQHTFSIQRKGTTQINDNSGIEEEHKQTTGFRHSNKHEKQKVVRINREKIVDYHNPSASANSNDINIHQSSLTQVGDTSANINNSMLNEGKVEEENHNGNTVTAESSGNGSEMERKSNSQIAVNRFSYKSGTSENNVNSKFGYKKESKHTHGKTHHNDKEKQTEPMEISEPMETSEGPTKLPGGVIMIKKSRKFDRNKYVKQDSSKTSVPTDSEKSSVSSFSLATQGNHVSEPNTFSFMSASNPLNHKTDHDNTGQPSFASTGLTSDTKSSKDSIDGSQRIADENTITSTNGATESHNFLETKQHVLSLNFLVHVSSDKTNETENNDVVTHQQHPNTQLSTASNINQPSAPKETVEGGNSLGIGSRSTENMLNHRGRGIGSIIKGSTHGADNDSMLNGSSLKILPKSRLSKPLIPLAFPPSLSILQATQSSIQIISKKIDSPPNDKSISGGDAEQTEQEVEGTEELSTQNTNVSQSTINRESHTGTSLDKQHRFNQNLSTNEGHVSNILDSNLNKVQTISKNVLTNDLELDIGTKTAHQQKQTHGKPVVSASNHISENEISNDMHIAKHVSGTLKSSTSDINTITNVNDIHGNEIMNEYNSKTNGIPNIILLQNSLIKSQPNLKIRKTDVRSLDAGKSSKSPNNLSKNSIHLSSETITAPVENAANNNQIVLNGLNTVAQKDMTVAKNRIEVKDISRKNNNETPFIANNELETNTEHVGIKAPEQIGPQGGGPQFPILRQNSLKNKIERLKMASNRGGKESTKYSANHIERLENMLDTKIDVSTPQRPTTDNGLNDVKRTSSLNTENSAKGPVNTHKFLPIDQTKNSSSNQQLDNNINNSLSIEIEPGSSKLGPKGSSFLNEVHATSSSPIYHQTNGQNANQINDMSAKSKIKGKVNIYATAAERIEAAMESRPVPRRSKILDRLKRIQKALVSRPEEAEIFDQRIEPNINALPQINSQQRDINTNLQKGKTSKTHKPKLLDISIKDSTQRSTNAYNVENTEQLKPQDRGPQSLNPRQSLLKNKIEKLKMADSTVSKSNGAHVTSSNQINYFTNSEKVNQRSVTNTKTKIQSKVNIYATAAERIESAMESRPVPRRSKLFDRLKRIHTALERRPDAEPSDQPIQPNTNVLPPNKQPLDGTVEQQNVPMIHKKVDIVSVKPDVEKSYRLKPNPQYQHTRSKRQKRSLPVILPKHFETKQIDVYGNSLGDLYFNEKVHNLRQKADRDSDLKFADSFFIGKIYDNTLDLSRTTKDVLENKILTIQVRNDRKMQNNNMQSLSFKGQSTPLLVNSFPYKDARFNGNGNLKRHRKRHTDDTLHQLMSRSVFKGLPVYSAKHGTAHIGNYAYTNVENNINFQTQFDPSSKDSSVKIITDDSKSDERKLEKNIKNMKEFKDSYASSGLSDMNQMLINNPKHIDVSKPREIKAEKTIKDIVLDAFERKTHDLKDIVANQMENVKSHDIAEDIPLSKVKQVPGGCIVDGVFLRYEELPSFLIEHCGNKIPSGQSQISLGDIENVLSDYTDNKGSISQGFSSDIPMVNMIQQSDGKLFTIQLPGDDQGYDIVIEPHLHEGSLELAIKHARQNDKNIKTTNLRPRNSKSKTDKDSLRQSYTNDILDKAGSQLASLTNYHLGNSARVGNFLSNNVYHSNFYPNLPSGNNGYTSSRDFQDFSADTFSPKQNIIGSDISIDKLQVNPVVPEGIHTTWFPSQSKIFRPPSKSQFTTPKQPNVAFENVVNNNINLNGKAIPFMSSPLIPLV